MNNNYNDNEAPTPQRMHRTDTTSASKPIVEATDLSPPVQECVRVQKLTMDTMEQMIIIHDEGFGSKYCCLCCPVADNCGKMKYFYEKHPERLAMCGVAFSIEDNASGGTPLGYVQLATFPVNDKDDLHITKPGETYIEQVSVSSTARGKGVGKLLLQWAEARAREQSSNVLTLSVINGNRARRLYERFGFEAVVPKTYINAACEQCIVGCMVCCLVGRPYGVCDPHFGYVDMRMPLL